MIFAFIVCAVVSLLTLLAAYDAFRALPESPRTSLISAALAVALFYSSALLWANFHILYR